MGCAVARKQEFGFAEGRCQQIELFHHDILRSSHGVVMVDEGLAENGGRLASVSSPSGNNGALRGKPLWQ